MSDLKKNLYISISEKQYNLLAIFEFFFSKCMCFH